MSSSNSPALVLELPFAWQRLIPAVVLLVAALLLPGLAFAWSPAMRISGVFCGLLLAVFAGWQAGISCLAKRITRVTWGQNDEWRLQFAAGDPVTAKLAADSWQSPWLMCWRFVDESGRSHGLLLWRSQFSPGCWHAWQLRLRLEGAHAIQAEAMGLGR